MKYLISILVFSVILHFTGCSNDETVVNNNTNVVSVRSVNDTLAISISATNHNYSQNIQLYFSTDTVKLNMSVNGYGSGNGQFKLLRDTNVIFSKDLNSTYSISQEVFPGPPTNAVIELQNYKGNAGILVSK